ncbi:hypothetical protein IEO21_05428 [Rhodonia placenta]|uniref:Uncharacterized protein n=1 Tax=Rhodonia placenta TaxID=104341 RepID=A0A8H7P221_9APHY|nr:hypothetical protein IEO21_05428 [Postia placenta]
MRQATTRCIQVSLPPIQFRPVTSPLSRPSLSPRPPSSRHQLTPSCARESHAENRLYSPVSSFRAKVLPHRAEARAVPALRDMSESSVGRAQGTTTNAPRIATVHVRPRACKSGQHSVRDHLPPARTPRPVSSPPPRDDLVCAAFPTAQCALRPLRLAAGRLGPRAPVVHAMPHSSSSPPPPTPARPPLDGQRKGKPGLTVALTAHPHTAPRQLTASSRPRATLLWNLRSRAHRLSLFCRPRDPLFFPAAARYQYNHKGISRNLLAVVTRRLDLARV